MKGPVILAVLALASLSSSQSTNTRFFGGGVGSPVGIGGLGGSVGIGGIGGAHGGIGGALVARNCLPSAPTSQRYGCEFFTEYGGQYVCDRNQKPRYQCPPVRPTCTRNFFGGPPQRCITDLDCSINDKCCCDACLEYTVCKPPA